MIRPHASLDVDKSYDAFFKNILLSFYLLKHFTKDLTIKNIYIFKFNQILQWNKHDKMLKIIFIKYFTMKQPEFKY